MAGKIKTREDYIKSFWDKINKNGQNGCWIWMGRKNSGGYGEFSNPIYSHRAHRFAYELLVEPIKDGNVICHKCDNPSCVNPEHLFQGTQADNMLDAIKKGRLFMPKSNKKSKFYPHKDVNKIYSEAIDLILWEHESPAVQQTKTRIIGILKDAKQEADEIRAKYEERKNR